MIKGLKLRKIERPATSKKMIIGSAVALLFLLFMGGGACWYFMVYAPQTEREEIQRREQKQLQADIKRVTDFYSSSLSGGGVPQFITLMAEIVRSDIFVTDIGYISEGMVCDTKTCSFSYKFRENAVFSIIKKTFWGELYSATFSESTFDFVNIPSRLDKNSVLSAYQEGKNITAHSCGDVLNYLYSWNSLAEDAVKIKIDSPPNSPVLAVEQKLSQKGKGKTYGLSFIKWSLPFPVNENSMLYIAGIFKSQAFNDAFIIQRIDSVTDKKISGAIVCKSGT